MFQVLIGRLVTFFVPGYAPGRRYLFQVLIGRLVTCQKNGQNVRVVQVSSPYRQASNWRIIQPKFTAKRVSSPYRQASNGPAKSAIRSTDPVVSSPYRQASNILTSINMVFLPSLVSSPYRQASNKQKNQTIEKYQQVSSPYRQASNDQNLATNTISMMQCFKSLQVGYNYPGKCRCQVFIQFQVLIGRLVTLDTALTSVKTTFLVSSPYRQASNEAGNRRNRISWKFQVLIGRLVTKIEFIHDLIRNIGFKSLQVGQ